MARYLSQKSASWRNVWLTGVPAGNAGAMQIAPVGLAYRSASWEEISLAEENVCCDLISAKGPIRIAPVDLYQRCTS